MRDRRPSRSLLLIFILVAAQALGLAATPVFAQRAGLSPADAARVKAVTRPATDFSKPEKYEAMSGGAATHRQPAGRKSFSFASANIGFADREDFNLGEALFDKLWVSAPASTKASDGLGPLFNARACASCHIGNGRGRAPDGVDDEGSLILSLSAGGGYGTVPDPAYGSQLQTRAIQGQMAEGRVETTYEEFPVLLDDGTRTVLRRPTYRLKDLSSGPIAGGTVLSPRMAPPMIGLGLVEQIAASDLEALEDPDDRDGDGISGHLSRVREPRTGQMAIGRYGWKASRHSVRAQSAAAFSNDIGLSTSLFPQHSGDCTQSQTACMSAPHGEQPHLGRFEVTDAVLDLVTFYAGNIAVPARRNVANPEVLEGKALFYGAGCISCHTPKFVTKRGDGANSFQLIWPYSDFLLHDMGEGLADQGTGNLTREWRTPPLWGIGLTREVLGEENYLHDGRARTLEEAILWHGGEAETARDAFAAMDREHRNALLSFLNSL
ncbi:di-heme oxidoredictase family protein [Hoeflea sp. TYP-13]|uniref:di-heme oxidoreductase family protein n=1 Tax=Hoeflea sp. TYP-13 TaxID=3230023 RepID=UPI0034C5D55D